MNVCGSMLLLMHTHDSLLKGLKIAYLCKLSVVFCFFLSERALLLPVKIKESTPRKWRQLQHALSASFTTNLVMYRHSSWEKNYGFTPKFNLDFNPVFTKLNLLNFCIQTVVPPVTSIRGLLKKTGSQNAGAFQRSINGTLFSGEFSKSLTSEQEAVGAYFASGCIDQWV